MAIGVSYQRDTIKWAIILKWGLKQSDQLSHVIQDSLGFWNDGNTRVSVARLVLFLYFQMPAKQASYGVRIPIVSGILDSLSWITDCKAQDSGLPSN